MSHLPTLDYFSNPNSCDLLTKNGTGHPSPSSTGLSVDIASPAKVQASLRIIDSELDIMGYSRVLCVQNGETKLIVDSLTENMLLVLRAYMKNVTVREELETTVRRYEADLTQTQKMYRRCQDNLEDSKRLSDTIKERERRLIEEKKTLNQQLKTATDEANPEFQEIMRSLDQVRKLQLNFQRHETQFNHERRKMEREIVSLKERLAATLCKSTNNSNIGRPKSKRQLTASTDFSSTWSLNADLESKEILSARNKNPGRNPSLTARENYGIRRVSSTAQTNANSENLSNSQNTKPDSSRSSWTIQDTALLASNIGGSQADLYSTVVQQLEARQHDLLYENREVRDLISQLSSKLVRFSLFVQTILGKQRCLKNGDHSPVPEDDFDSLDEADDELDQHLEARSSSEDETPGLATSNSIDLEKRRKSADVNKLLLELPYPLVRDHLTRRVRQLSRNLWKQLKQLTPLNLPVDGDGDNMKSRTFVQPLLVDKENSGSVVKSSSLDMLCKMDDSLATRTQLSELQSPVSKSHFKIADTITPVRSDQTHTYSSSSDIFRNNWARAVFTQSPFPKRVISSVVDSNK